MLLIKEMSNVWNKIEFDLVTALFAMGMLLLSMIGNQLIGAVMAKEADQFDKDRLIKSFKKGALITVGILVICLVSDLFPVLLERVNIVSTDFSNSAAEVITALQFIAIIVITIMKYLKEVYQKMLTLFEVNDDDVKKLVTQQNSSEFKEETL